MNGRLLVLSLSLVFAPLAATAEEAVRELGQADFSGFMPNRVDGRGLAQPWGVAVDTSRSPNGLWVLDASNNRVLGWRDVTTLHDGKRADVVIGQPDELSVGCNTGGVSAASLCFVQSFNGYAYSPGLAVDAEGNLYVADQYNLRVLGYRRPFDTDGVADLVIGQPGFNQLEPWSGVSATRLYRLHGLAVDAQGNLYVGDEIRVLELDRPFATDGVADRVFGQSSLDTHDVEADPGAPDRMAYADGIAVDAQGRLYVADAWMDRVMVWEQPLARQGAADLIFSQGVRTCDYRGCNSKGIAIEPGGDVWVGSHEQGRIFGYRSPLEGDTEPDRVIVAINSGQVYDPEAPRDGRPMFAAGGLAVDSSGTLWLTDTNRVLGFFDPWNGNGRADRLLGQVRRDQIVANLVDHDGLAGPDGIAIDTSVDPPRLYVVDASNHRVLGWADAAGFANGQPADLVIGQPDRWSSGCNTGGRSLASLCIGSRPMRSFGGIDVDARGTVWVSDPGNARVLGFRSPFTTDTVADRVLGGIGCATGPRGMCIPGGLAVDKTGSLYVADIANNRILWFNQPLHRRPEADRVLGARNLRQKWCNDPATCFSAENGSHPGLDIDGGSLAVDSQGRLLVGNGGFVYVFDRPLLAGARSRKLIDLSGIEGYPYYPPQDLATDSSDRIYLTSGYRVYRFSRDGAGPTLELGERCVYGYDTGLPEGFGPASMCLPTGLAVGPGDELFVADMGANRVLVFDNP